MGDDACTSLPLAENHKRIWLQPVCQVDERCWCEDPQPCDDCGLPAVEYIRADIVEAENARLRAAMQEACDLLAERKHGSPARSPGHNARLRLETSLATAPESPT